MEERGAYGQQLGEVFQLDRAPAFVTRSLQKSKIAVTEIKFDIVNNGLTAPIPREEAFLVTLQLRDCPRHDLFINDRPADRLPARRRAFRQSKGLSPHQWLLRRRVEQAKALLRDRTLSLSDVALSCGFADQSHLTRVFTRLNGVSPGSWRRNLE